MSEGAIHAAIESVARHSYGRLIAYLAARSGDVAGAEDALGDAFVAALRHWPVEGLPQKPEAWLLHAARNRRIDAGRRQQIRATAAPLLIQLADQAQSVANADTHFPDERLKLLFVCAHPAIHPDSRTPLMLQTVLGIDAARIASAFLVSSAAMGRRLVRAKEKIRLAAIPFVVPEPPEWEERVGFVLDALYAAFTAGWEDGNDPGAKHHTLAAEAVAIGRTLVQLMPQEPEALGLLALMLHSEARRPTRFTQEGEFIPITEQNPALWSRELIDEAETLIRSAATRQHLGRYQLEAAIQSIHAHRAVTGHIDWAQIVLLYAGLLQIAPSIGARVGHAVALAQSGQPEAGLTRLDELATASIADYQPYWAARGHLLHLLGRKDAARSAFARAIELTPDPALRAYLNRRAVEVS